MSLYKVGDWVEALACAAPAFIPGGLYRISNIIKGCGNSSVFFCIAGKPISETYESYLFRKPDKKAMDDCDFDEGDEVECVDATSTRLTRGVMYTITLNILSPNPQEEVMVKVTIAGMGLDIPGEWRQSRFRG